MTGREEKEARAKIDAVLKPLDHDTRRLVLDVVRGLVDAGTASEKIQKIAAQVSWVANYQKGPENAPYIPALRTAARGHEPRAKESA